MDECEDCIHMPGDDVNRRCKAHADMDVIMDMVDQWRIEAEEENVGEY